MSEFIGRRRREITPGENESFDRVLALAEQAITARSPVSFKALTAAVGLTYTRWLSLRDRICRTDRPRLRRLNEIQTRVLDLGLSARGRVTIVDAASLASCHPSSQSPAFEDAKPAPAQAEPAPPAPPPAHVDARQADTTRALIERAHDRLVREAPAALAPPAAAATVRLERPVAPCREALAQVLSVVEDLDPAARRRVLRAAAEFYAVG